MKQTIFLISFVLALLQATAQEDYKTVMLQSIQALDTTSKDAQNLVRLASTFEALHTYGKSWQPLYYECLSYIKLSTAYTNIEQRKAAIDKAAELLKDLPEGNDEVQVVRAMYAMNYLGIDRSAWVTFMPKINNGLDKAEEINPDNPRIYYLRGLLKYNMPVMMGGGTEVGIKLFQQSLQKFDTFRSKDEFAPTWGRKEVVKYLGENGKTK
jgi:hypothetical protein